MQLKNLLAVFLAVAVTHASPVTIDGKEFDLTTFEIPLDKRGTNYFTTFGVDYETWKWAPVSNLVQYFEIGTSSTTSPSNTAANWALMGSGGLSNSATWNTDINKGHGGK